VLFVLNVINLLRFQGMAEVRLSSPLPRSDHDLSQELSWVWTGAVFIAPLGSINSSISVDA
jgi:hypothetical protein